MSSDSSDSDVSVSGSDSSPRPHKRRRLSPPEYNDRKQNADPSESAATFYNAPSRVKRQPESKLTVENAPELAHVLGQPTKPTTSTSFAGLPLAPWLQHTLRTLSINNPTPIQLSTIPPTLSGGDVLASSPTGTGKTLAFALPILHTWSVDPLGIYALVLTPTRELALQIYEQFSALGAPQDLKVVLITGGSEMRPQALALEKRPHVVVATPGRLADHIRQSGEDTVRGLKRVKVMVLDEADRLLSREAHMLDDLGTCLSALPPRTQRQTLCYTATMTDEVRALRNTTQSKSHKIFISELTTAETTQSTDNITVSSTQPTLPPKLMQTYLPVPSPQKPAYLHILLTLQSLTQHQTIIFTNRTSTTDLLHRTLLLLSHSVTSLHSQLAQKTRNRNLSDFRARKARILISTDVGSRGLDIPDVGLVINYDVPRDPDDYIHRVGRTARAGHPGTSITLVGARDVDLLHAIEQRVDQSLHTQRDVTDGETKWQMSEFSEEGVNIETRVVKDGGKVLKEVGVARMEALRGVQAGRDEKGYLRRMRKGLR